MKLLFVTPAPPDRPDRDGMTQIAQGLIAELGPRHDIDVWTLSDESPAPTVTGAKNVRVFWRSNPSIWSYYLSGSSLPYFQARHQSSALHQALQQLPADTYDLVILHSPFVAHYLPDVQGPVVIHVIDALSDWFRKTAQTASFLKKLHLLSEATKAARMEQGLGAAKALTTVSEVDAATLHHAVPSVPVTAIPIGLDPQLLRPSTEPRLVDTVVMTGIMDYPPNVDAAQFFGRQVWPNIFQKYPQAKLRIVGRRPSPAVQALSTIPGVTVTGEVPSVADELRRATIAVSPLRFGTGYKIKINEALACGAPVIASPASLPGTGVTPGVTCLMADTPAEWIQTLNELLADPTARQRLSQAGLAFAQTRAWPAIARQYETVYHSACEK